MFYMSVRAAAAMRAQAQAQAEAEAEAESGQSSAGELSTTKAATITAQVPTSLAYVPHPRSGRVFFDPPRADSTRIIRGYQVSVDDGATWSRTQPASDFAWLPQLDAGHRCLVRVRAATANGPEPASAAIRVVIGESEAPATEQAASTGLDALMLTLAPPATRTEPTPAQESRDSADGFSYIYEYSLDGCRTWAEVPLDHPLVLTRANPDQPYALWLRPVG